MHELSIAMRIVEIADEEARRLELPKVRGVHLKLGTFSGVVKEALLSAYEVAREGSLVEEARLVIQEVPIVIYCPTCCDESAVDSIQQLCCARCGTLSGEIVSGKEMELTGLEVDQ